MKLDDWLARRASETPERTALEAGGERLTYGELDAEVAVAARGLAGEGVVAGDLVEIQATAGIGYAVRLHALSRLGAVAYPLDPRLGAEELEAARAPLERPPGLAPSEVHCRILTSGTSGRPRPVELTHSNHHWSAFGSGLTLGVRPRDRWLCCVPLFHVSGLMILVRSAIYGTAAEIHDGFDTDRVAAALEGGEVTLVSLVATQLARLLDAGANLVGPRAIVLGGGPVPAELLEQAIERGATVVQTYGMTETDSQVSTLFPADASRKLGSVGRALLSVEIRIAPDDEILVRGPVVAPGMPGEDGWLRTGDLGRLDEEGFLYVTGRRGEMIITGGENVMPREIEEVLLRHPAVADAGVVGRRDPDWQEAVTAVVVLRDAEAVTESALREHAAASLAAFKVPKRIEFADSLPRTASGKLLRNELEEAG